MRPLSSRPRFIPQLLYSSYYCFKRVQQDYAVAGSHLPSAMSSSGLHCPASNELLHSIPPSRHVRTTLVLQPSISLPMGFIRLGKGHKSSIRNVLDRSHV
ncbi:hypothetical protein Mapa_016958 [Marchantia paleacea]|nr:hypothetical protein Mapa_016958 [Marchantia paleacea]